MGDKFGKLIYDSGTVAAGAAIDSGYFDVREASHLMASVLNFAGDAARALVCTFSLDGGTSAISGSLTLSTAALGTNRLVGIGPGFTTTAGINLDCFPLGLPSYVKFTVAAAGTGSLRVVVWARCSDRMR